MNRAQRSAFRSPSSGLFSAAIVALASVSFWWRDAFWLLTIAAIAGGVASIVGWRFGRSRLRWYAGIGLAFVAAMLGWWLIGWISRWTLPIEAEKAVAGLHAARVALTTSAAAFSIGFVTNRYRWSTPIPAALLVLSIARLLAAHRGGDIHLPKGLSDPAWATGVSPGTALASIGILAGLLACFALFRSGLARFWPHALVVALLAWGLSFVAPEMGLLRFSAEDSLGLRRSIQDDERPAPSGLGEEIDGAGENGGGDDPLGLTQSESGEGGTQPPGDFREEYSSSSNPPPIAVVVLHDDVEPFRGVFYFRQFAQSSWNGRRLVRSLSRGMDDDIFGRFPTVSPIQLDPAPGGESIRQNVPTTVSLMQDHPAPPVMSAGETIRSAPISDRALFSQSYRAESRVLVAQDQDLIGRTAGSSMWPDAVTSRYLDAPDDPRYAALAKETLSLLNEEYRDDPWARTIGVQMWLEENTYYSLRPGPATESDPVASFLFGSRVGYCVHLAHATALLLRELDVPSRVALGYAYEASHRDGGSALMLRTSDAHAWAEAYIAGVGWVPVDPSPPSLDPEAPIPDLDLQRLLGELSRPESEMHDAGQGPLHWFSRRFFALVLVGGLALWAFIGYLIKAFRRVQHVLMGSDPSRLAYRVSLDRLAEVGLSRDFGETREAFADRARGVSPSFSTLTRAHLGSRFGRNEIDPGRARALAQLVKRQIGRRSDPKHRLFGLVRPWSWTRSR